MTERTLETGVTSAGPEGAQTRPFDVAIVGAGYVGVPLARAFAEADRRVVLVDVVPEIVDALNRGESHIQDVPSETLARLVQEGALVIVPG